MLNNHQFQWLVRTLVITPMMTATTGPSVRSSTRRLDCCLVVPPTARTDSPPRNHYPPLAGSYLDDALRSPRSHRNRVKIKTVGRPIRVSLLDLSIPVSSAVWARTRRPEPGRILDTRSRAWGQRDIDLADSHRQRLRMTT